MAWDWVLEVTQLRGCGNLACASAKPNANISGMNLLVPRAALRPLPTSYKRKSALVYRQHLKMLTTFLSRLSLLSGT
jgi:hypothetical protein